MIYALSILHALKTTQRIFPTWAQLEIIFQNFFALKEITLISSTRYHAWLYRKLLGFSYVYTYSKLKKKVCYNVSLNCYLERIFV